MKLIKTAIRTWIDWLLVAEAEARTSISLIEAAAVDQFQTDLAKMDSTPEGRQSIRDSAILLAQLGVRADEVENMARIYHMARVYGISQADIRNVADIKRRARSES